MKENEWVSVYECLPKPNEKCIVGNEGIDKVISEIGEDVLSSYYYDLIGKFGFIWLCNNQGITHWRYIVEKRPDFSKLNSKDLIIINDICTGYFNSIGDEEITISIYSIEVLHHTLPINNIKKITRINIEEQTFEEI